MKNVATSANYFGEHISFEFNGIGEEENDFIATLRLWRDGHNTAGVHLTRKMYGELLDIFMQEEK